MLRLSQPLYILCAKQLQGPQITMWSSGAGGKIDVGTLWLLCFCLETWALIALYYWVTGNNGFKLASKTDQREVIVRAKLKKKKHETKLCIFRLNRLTTAICKGVKYSRSIFRNFRYKFFGNFQSKGFNKLHIFDIFGLKFLNNELLFTHYCKTFLKHKSRLNQDRTRSKPALNQD